MPTLAKITTKKTLASVYESTYNAKFNTLSLPMKQRVLACKEDPSIIDRDVIKFIRDVISAAEEAYDKLLNSEKEAALKKV